MKSFAKINIFLKIVGTRDNYHLISSRFMLVKTLFDEITFEKKLKNNNFELIGNFGCETKSNTIYKVYQKLLTYTNSKKLQNFFTTHKIVVDKKIPEFAGLGGGSSNAGTFLNMCNDKIKLNLSKNQLAKIGGEVGADIPFFVYNYDSANVTGIGEIVKEFKEKPLNFEITTPPILSNTEAVYKNYRKNYLQTIDKNSAKKLLTLKSADILKNYNATILNDLLNPSIDLNPKLKKYQKQNYFFSGSGSSFFRILNSSHKIIKYHTQNL